MKLVEVNNNNKKQYLKKIVDMENVVVEKNIAENRSHTFFSAGADGIEEFIDSKNDKLFIYEDNGVIVSVVIIAFYDEEFSYDDISLYFKQDERNIDYHENQHIFGSFEDDLLEAYNKKLEVFKKVCLTYGSQEELLELIEKDRLDTDFMLKSPLRKEINDRIIEISKNDGCKDAFENFYFLNLLQLKNRIKGFNQEMITEPDYVAAYEIFLEYSKLTVYENNISPDNSDLYYSSDVFNTLEVIFFANPNYFGKGATTDLTINALENILDEKFSDSSINEYFISLTFHPENYGSHKITDFCEIKDELLVLRRKDIVRNIRILRVTRDDYKDYIAKLRNKIAYKKAIRILKNSDN